MIPTPEEAVLLWAVNPDAYTIPDVHEADPDTLLRLALTHRVVGLLLAQFEKDLPRGLPRLFVARLRFLEHKRRNLYREQINYAQSLTGKFGTLVKPIIFLKGFSSYAVTSDERLKRPVHDFDLISSDLPVLYDFLMAEGLEGKRHFTHEYGKFTGGLLKLDLHEYFPVRSYPKEAWHIDPSALTLPDEFESHQLPELPSDLVESGIYYEDLLRHSQKGTAPGTEQLTFPTPEMACLILCAHAFRDVTVRFHYMGDQVLVRLGELADVNALASAPNFDPDTFVALVNQFNAADSVAWVARQCERFFGQSFLPRFEEAANRTALTVEHLSLGHWVYLGEPLLQTRSGTTLLKRLNCKTVALRESETTAVPLTPILHRGVMPRSQMRIELSKDRVVFHFEWEEKVKSVRIQLLNDRYVACHFDRGELSTHRFKDLELSDFLLPDGEPQSICTEQGMHLRIQFFRPAGLYEIPCFVEQQTETSSAYIPLRFVFGDE